MIGFCSHIKEPESPVTQDTLKLTKKIYKKDTPHGLQTK